MTWSDQRLPLQLFVLDVEEFEEFVNRCQTSTERFAVVFFFAAVILLFDAVFFFLAAVAAIVGFSILDSRRLYLRRGRRTGSGSAPQ